MAAGGAAGAAIERAGRVGWMVGRWGEFNGLIGYGSRQMEI